MEITWSQNIDIGDLANIFTSGIALLIAYYVYSHTKKKDRLEFIFSEWTDQIEINMSTASSDVLLSTWEEIVYGKEYVPNVKRARRWFMIFQIINRVRKMYSCVEQGVFSKEEFIVYVRPTVRLLANAKDDVKYLLSERGYDPKFASEMLTILESVAPSVPPRNSSGTADAS